jgi:uncharacterized protein YraI
MRRFLIILAAAALTLCLPAVVLARPEFVTTTLYLRAGPGTEYPMVDAMPGGARVDIRGCTSRHGWCDLMFGGEYGWASAEYLRFSYQGRRVPLIGYWGYAGIPIVNFAIGPYWRRHYRQRRFYGRLGHYRDYYRHHHRYRAHHPRGDHARQRMTLHRRRHRVKQLRNQMCHARHKRHGALRHARHRANTHPNGKHARHALHRARLRVHHARHHVRQVRKRAHHVRRHLRRAKHRNHKRKKR